jgi:hypothetical protein
MLSIDEFVIEILPDIIITEKSNWSLEGIVTEKKRSSQ